MSNMMTFNDRLNLFKFNYETYKLAYNNDRYDLCKKLFNDEMLYFLNNTSYELMDSILTRINLFEDLKLSRKTLYESFIRISAQPLLNYLYNIKENKQLKESKSMPELTTFTIKENNDDIDSISDNVSDNVSDSISDNVSNTMTNSISSGDILEIDDVNEATKVILPKVQEKGILSFLFGV